MNKPLDHNPTQKFETFANFWPHYLSEHTNPTNRILHIFGTTLAVSIAIYAWVFAMYPLLLAVPFCGYGGAWVGHFFIEKNTPTTFSYPLFSLFADFKMCGLFYTGQINKELQRCNLI